jgi:hypothetical protein
LICVKHLLLLLAQLQFPPQLVICA